jgi:hypothetical protein
MLKKEVCFLLFIVYHCQIPYFRRRLTFRRTTPCHHHSFDHRKTTISRLSVHVWLPLTSLFRVPNSCHLHVPQLSIPEPFSSATSYTFVRSKLLKIYLCFQDIASRTMSFCCNGWAVCILQANGIVSNVTLRQDSSRGTVSYEVCSFF